MSINSQEKGKRAERDLAKWWKVNGYPDAERAVKTGTKQKHDAGDLILEWRDFRLCVEVKHHAGGLTDLQVQLFGEKLSRQCVQSKSNMGILVERRDRVSDAGRWWVHLDAPDFAWLQCRAADRRRGPVPWRLTHQEFRPTRVPLAYLATLLRQAGLAQPCVRVSSSAASGHAEFGTEPQGAQAVGGT